VGPAGGGRSGTSCGLSSGPNQLEGGGLLLTPVALRGGVCPARACVCPGGPQTKKTGGGVCVSCPAGGGAFSGHALGVLPGAGPKPKLWRRLGIVPARRSLAPARGALSRAKASCGGVCVNRALAGVGVCSGTRLRLFQRAKPTAAGIVKEYIRHPKKHCGSCGTNCGNRVLL